MHTKKERQFIHISSLFSIIHALGYLWHGFHSGFSICIIAMIVIDALYVPCTTIKNVKLFPVYLVAFSSVLVFITAFTTSELFNNYSALLCIFVAILIKPQLKNILMALYLITSAIAFCVAGDEVYFLVIHFSRAMWIFVIYDFIIYAKYERKPVILFDEEIAILDQLSQNLLMKEIELDGYSERTIRRRLDSAKDRSRNESGMV